MFASSAGSQGILDWTWPYTLWLLSWPFKSQAGELAPSGHRGTQHPPPWPIQSFPGVSQTVEMVFLLNINSYTSQFLWETGCLKEAEPQGVTFHPQLF